VCLLLVLKLEVTEESKRIASSPTSAPAPDDNDVWDFELQRQTEMRILQDIENLEERICSASLQTKVCSANTLILSALMNVQLVALFPNYAFSFFV